jgi:hypothetical protein
LTLHAGQCIIETDPVNVGEDFRHLGECLLSQNLFFAGRAPVTPADIRIESVGVRPMDERRVDVAADLTPCLQPVTVEMVIVGPDDDELACVTLVHNRDWMLDKVLHLRQDAQVGEHILHIGVFYDGELVARAARRFSFFRPEPE